MQFSFKIQPCGMSEVSVSVELPEQCDSVKMLMSEAKKALREIADEWYPYARMLDTAKHAPTTIGIMEFYYHHNGPTGYIVIEKVS